MSNNPELPVDRDEPRSEGPGYPHDASVEERDTSPPEARRTRGVSPGSVRLLFLIAGAVIVIFVIVLLSGV